jgi:hypothetical protein
MTSLDIFAVGCSGGARKTVPKSDPLNWSGTLWGEIRAFLVDSALTSACWQRSPPI